MPDLTSQLIPHLKAHKIPGLDLPEPLVHPNYDGYSILNTPNGLCSLLDIPPKNGTPPLAPEILVPLGNGIQKVLVVLMDALTLHRLQAWMADRPDMVWNQLAEDGVLAPLTSISPSTTSAALSTYWTGVPASVHGVTGYEMWLKEYGMVVNSILHTPFSFRGGPVGSLSQAGFLPKEFLPADPNGPHFAAHGVTPHVFQDYSIIDSGLSQMFFDQTQKHGTGSAVDMWYRIHQLWESSKDEKLFAWAYWPIVDGLSHFHGPDDLRVKEEFAAFSQAFETLFLNKLSAKAQENTVVILTADHGQITTNKEDDHYDLRNHPDFTRRLHIMPTGENRLAFLHIRPGQTEAVREYVERTWPNQFTLLESAYAMEKGLFGPGSRHPGLLDRTGDMIAIASGNAYWWWSNKPNPLIGRHGGLSAEEMIVPFLAARL